MTNTDHPWMVCQGVPYGTSLWQVADSSKQNGQGTSRSNIGCDLEVNENGDIINIMIVDDNNMDVMEL